MDRVMLHQIGAFMSYGILRTLNHVINLTTKKLSARVKMNALGIRSPAVSQSLRQTAHIPTQQLVGQMKPVLGSRIYSVLLLAVEIRVWAVILVMHRIMTVNL